MPQEAGRYQYFVLQATDAKMVPVLRALNPSARFLVYQDPKFSRPSDYQGLTVCSVYSQIATAHPDWFVRNAAGAKISPGAYSSSYIMDVGNPAYQQYCLAHSVALAKADGFDGVFFDDFSAVLKWTFPAGAATSTPQYTSDGAWQAAMYSMISYAGAQMHANGLLAVGNIGGAWTTPGLWAKWNGPLDGAEEEDFAGTGTAGQQLASWPSRLGEAQWSAANGKIALLHSYSPNETANTFDMASMMLTAGGKSSYCTANVHSSGPETWYPEYDSARQLGAPVGGYKQLANGVYERVFAHGIVLVNPTARPVSRFSLGGGTYSGSRLAQATSATMPAKTGLILVGG